MENPKPGSQWVRYAHPSMGPVRVMAVVENYVVARHKGAAPFLKHLSDWEREFRPSSPTAPDKAGDALSEGSDGR